MSETNLHLPGKLGNPGITLAADKRADPRLRAVSDLLDVRPPGSIPA